jgi:3-hydroxyisobutyrate dehydrogenase-like beta-hydroxyacid dehydrogenase
VILICIDNYTVTNAMLRTEGVASLVAGRTIVQLSTGTPKEAEELSAWMAARHAVYLDGAILAGPEEIGTANGQILLSGERAGYDRASSLLDCLSKRLRYLGTNVRAASALDLAWLTTCYSRFVGIIHAANMCRSEGVGVDEFIALFPDQPDIQDYAQVIHGERYHECNATLEVWGAALKRIQQQANDSNISSEIPDFFADFFKKAIGAGFGKENVMALFKVVDDVHK